MAETIGNTDIIKLSNELIYQRHLFNREHRKDVFMKMSIPEYIALHILQWRRHPTFIQDESI